MGVVKDGGGGVVTGYETLGLQRFDPDLVDLGYS